MKYSYNLRGTNGSGKTRVARALLEESKAKPILYLGKKVRAYQGSLDDNTIIILGSYETACGGCDTIDSVAEVAELLHHSMTGWGKVPGHYTRKPYEDTEPDKSCVVFFEGLMISHMLGTVGAMQAKLGKDRNILAFLDTPLEKCIEHVMTRRMLRKDDRPFDPKNVIKDHPRVQQCRKNAEDQGYQVVGVPWQDSITWVRQSIFNLTLGVGAEV